jgi:signal transduction histidine kinase
MLDVSRIEAGRLLLNYEHFDLTALVQEVVTNLRPSTEAHRFAIEAEPGIEIEADATRVEQVLINLISNAVTYSPEGGEVAVRVWQEGGAAKIAVRDTGVGIAPDELPHLFERFYRAPRAGVMRSGGMGLGLYISNEIVHRHGGTITVKSNEGVGSTFTVTLPLTGKD